MSNQAAPGKKGLTQRGKEIVSLYNPRIWKEKGLWWTGGLFIVTYFIVVVILGVIWSKTPPTFDVRENALELAGGDEAKVVTGSYTTGATIRIAETLLDKPGGYLSNDLLPPGDYLDNMPNWEFGALTELRDVAEALRNELSRSQSQSVEDKDLQIAHPQFNYNSQSWILPSTESEYRKGVEALKRYYVRLGDERATDGQFFARADNLSHYLQVVEQRLGSFANRLSYAVGKTEYDTSGVGDAGSRHSTPVPERSMQKTPWMEIDDVFFEARGYTWALLHTLKAMEIDFKSVLADKTAEVPLKQIIRELEYTQNMIWSPMILNGTGFGPMANHSLVMASYISRANAGVIDLRRLLQQG